MSELASNNSQIIALLNGRTFELVCECTGKTSVDENDYAAVFTVNQSAILEYVRINGFPLGSFFSEPQSHDGIYMIESHDVYTIYYQERGIKFHESVFSSKEEANSALVDQLITHSGARQYVQLENRKKGLRLKQFLSRILGRNKMAP